MKTAGIVGLAMMLSLVPLAVGWSHSLEELENQLGDREKFFQPMDEPAPGFTLQDAEGRAVGLDDFRGKVVVLFFLYTNCPDVCPLHAERIAEVQARVNRTPLKDRVRFVGITTDPARDTAEVMRAYGPAHGLDPASWVFLTGGADRPEDTTRLLARKFGHKFAKGDDGYQLHGVVTHVIDREGRWRANFHGLKFEPANLVTFLDALANDTHTARGQSERGFWDKLRALF